MQKVDENALLGTEGSVQYLYNKYRMLVGEHYDLERGFELSIECLVLNAALCDDNVNLMEDWLNMTRYVIMHDRHS